MKNSIAICIVTYNHDKYISQAIESVLVQETDAPFKVFIGEDCSTDKTREICQEYKNRYPEKIELVFSETNQGLVKNNINLLKRIQGDGFEYVAMLDGDDYWIDKTKLQKQYELFESNAEVGFIHTNNDILWDDGTVERTKKNNPLNGYVFDSIENFNVANCSVLYRTALLNYIDFDQFVNQGFMSCDYAMYAVFSKYTKFGFLDDYTAVWRRGHSSVSNPNSKVKDIAYIENDIRMWNYLGNKFPERFGHTLTQADAWRNFRVFNIAFRYKDFKLANSILKNNNMQGRNGFSFKIKKLAASNRFLFNLWGLLKR